MKYKQGRHGTLIPIKESKTMQDKCFDFMSVKLVEFPAWQGYHNPACGVTLARKWNNDVLTILDIDWARRISVFHVACVRWGAEVAGKRTLVVGLTPWFEVGFYDSEFWLSIGPWYFTDGKWNSTR